jgi:hypothetical protein
MTRNELEIIATALGPVVREYVAGYVAQLAARVGTVEARMTQYDVGLLRERVAVLETRAPVPGPPGAPGRDGVDGLGFDDVGFEHDGERGFTFRAKRGELVRDCGTFALPVLIYRGVYTPDHDYAVGDVVTYGGSAWHCYKATRTRPETAEGAAAWRLMVKRGDRGKG